MANNLPFMVNQIKSSRSDFRATSPYIIGDESTVEEQREVRLRVFEKADDSSSSSDIKMSEIFPFRCVCPNDQLPVKNIGDQVVGVGVDVILPLALWLTEEIGRHNIENWPATKAFKGFDSKLRKMGRLVGTLMYQHHVNGDFLGISLSSAFVKQGNLLYDDDCKECWSDDPIEGIKYDLHQFRSFLNRIIWLTKFDRGFHTEDANSVVRLAQDLCDEANIESLISLEEVQNLSYFVCHIPLFWEYDQRRDFSYAFFQLCKKFKFQHQIQFLPQYRTTIDPNWSNIVSKSLPQPYLCVLQYRTHLQSGSQYTTKVSLLLFHRACHIHLKDYEGPTFTAPENIDNALQQHFPAIIPKAWYALYKQILSIQPKLIQFLKCYPGKLNYVNPGCLDGLLGNV